MASPQIGTAQGSNANTSRWARLFTDGIPRNHGESWRRSFRRSRQAVNSSDRLLTIARQIIDTCGTIAAEHPIRATHEMQRASVFLAEAAERLGRSATRMCETFARLYETQADPGDAPARISEAVERWLENVKELARLTSRFDATFAELVAYVNSGKAPLDLSELLKRRTHPVPVIARHPRPRVLSIENDRIFCIRVRRQRPSLLSVAEAPKRVSRGRAPPPVSICSL